MLHVRLGALQMFWAHLPIGAPFLLFLYGRASNGDEDERRLQLRSSKCTRVNINHIHTFQYNTVIFIVGKSMFKTLWTVYL